MIVAPTLTMHRVTLGELSRDGNARAEIHMSGEDGQTKILTLYVPAGLPGEEVTIAVEWPNLTPPKRHRRRWKPRQPRAWITDIHHAAPERVAAPCPIFGECGGCQLQHMDYAAQLVWKRDTVGQLLKDVGRFEDPNLLDSVPCSPPWNYRNHMRFSVNRDGQVGLTVRGTHRVLPLAHCPIAHEQINRALSVLSRLPNARPQVLIRCGAATSQAMIQPQPSPDVARQLEEAGLDLRGEVMEERLGGATFRIRPSSFFQTNTAQAEQMMSMVVRGLLEVGKDEQQEHQHSTLVDAYCGVGTFSRILARYADKVIAIEESPSAIRDAQWNLQGLDNVQILKGKVEEALPALAEEIDGLVIDPPRAGCQRVVLDALLAHPVRRIVYVSCDPSTLARDLNILCHPGTSNNSTHSIYRLHSVQPLDMFPQTAHIECVAVLEQQKQ